MPYCKDMVLKYDANSVLFTRVLFVKLKQVVTVQKVERSDALVYTNDVLQCVYCITYKANKRMMWRKISPTVFDVIDPTVFSSN